MLGFIIIVIIIFIGPLCIGEEKKACDFCDSKNLIESENYGRSHEENYHYCSVCGHFQD